MVIRSPSCFILRSVLMVTFFKVHLRGMWSLAGACLPGSPPERLSSGQPGSGQIGATWQRIASVGHSAPGGRPNRPDSDNLQARAHGLVVVGAALDGGDGAGQFLEVLFALHEV